MGGEAETVSASARAGCPAPRVRPSPSALVGHGALSTVETVEPGLREKKGIHREQDLERGQRPSLAVEASRLALSLDLALPIGQQ